MKGIVLITGAANGIGAAIVRKYLKNTDQYIIAIDINGKDLLKTRENISPENQIRFIPLVIDLTKEKEIKQKVMQEIKKRGAIEHVVISHAVGYNNEINEDNKWDHILNVNLHSTQRLLSAIEGDISKNGRVVILSSILGRVGKANNTAYVSSKHALLGLVKALALDWAKRKITVNSVLPCWVDTPMMRKELEPQAAMMGVPLSQMLRKIKKSIPLRQLVSPDDVADTVMYLTSPQAKMITAQSIVIDGGFGCGV